MDKNLKVSGIVIIGARATQVDVPLELFQPEPLPYTAREIAELPLVQLTYNDGRANRRERRKQERKRR
jgi:hypothetical protein